MSYEDQWRTNEEQLLRETCSLGELLEQIKGLFSPLLIRDRAWDGLVKCAGALPPTLAAFPLWLGFPLNESQEGTELCVSLLGGTKSAAFFENRRRAEDADPATASIAFLLGETGPKDSPLRRVVGDRVLLEYDVDSGSRHGPQNPRISLYPIRPTLAGDHADGRLQDLGVALDAMTSAVGWEPNAVERRQVERAYLALNPDARIGGISALPSSGGGIGLTTLGFVKARDVTAFLERAGWPWQTQIVASILSRLDHRRALDGVHLGVQFVVGADGVGPALELHIFSQNRMYEHQGWFKDKLYWSSLMDGICREGFAVPEKLSELAKWSSGAKPLFGRSGPFVVLQRIHHFKFVLTEERIHQVKGHVFLLMCCAPQSGKSTG
ncbi:MAG: hypothetical protein OXI53_04395 [Nitrospira sp.]|nr:hypothetical protein [Nitrospira sp.]MDE0486252.1 hypothetical protein [Nitrospira sp.]